MQINHVFDGWHWRPLESLRVLRRQVGDGQVVEIQRAVPRLIGEALNGDGRDRRDHAGVLQVDGQCVPLPIGLHAITLE